jgi:Mce-associated membrane protein
MSDGRRRVAWWALVISLGVIAVAATSVGYWQFMVKSREVPVVADEASRRQAIMDVARASTVKILSYNVDTVVQDTQAAAEVTTGDFLTYYKQFTSEVVVPTAQQKRVSTTAAVVQVGVISLTEANASVLVYINQNTTSTENPQGAFAASAVRLGMTLVNGRWLIERFDPV